MTNTTEQSLSLRQMVDLYRQMLSIRSFEEHAIRLFGKGLITGSTHPYIGQEAISVGVCSALRREDQVLATYRGHGAAIAKGCPPRELMAELLTKVTGCCMGRGGSMHLCNPQYGFIGTNAIVAAHIPIAGGVALANKIRKNGQVTVCLFGDGASCEGEFFETLNMAALWKVPLIFICENNGYAISVPTSLSQSTPDIADRGRGFGISSVIVDGNDLLAVRFAVVQAVERGRNCDGPTLIECKTTRWERHSAFSSGRYENPEEATKWKKVDPIPRFKERLSSEGAAAEVLDAAERQARAEIDDAVEFAKNSESALPGSIYEGIFAE